MKTVVKSFPKAVSELSRILSHLTGEKFTYTIGRFQQVRIAKSNKVDLEGVSFPEDVLKKLKSLNIPVETEYGKSNIAVMIHGCRGVIKDEDDYMSFVVQE